jgi:AraC family transcriptional regulator, regulatory protein of adaptative response / methylated-DNA-[protein]-cysteine methyltransferase
MTSRANRAWKDWTFEFVIPTCDGEFLARYSEAGLCGLNFPSPTLRTANVSDPQEVPEPIRSWHVLTVEALRAALEGRAPGRFPPLDLSSGSEFQQRVWQRLLQITPGRTESYGEVAAAIGRPKATRAVGGACGSNPIPVLVPCHRVLAAHQRIGGFSSDPKWKWELLAREGVRPKQE